MKKLFVNYKNELEVIETQRSKPKSELEQKVDRAVEVWKMIREREKRIQFFELRKKEQEIKELILKNGRTVYFAIEIYNVPERAMSGEVITITEHSDGRIEYEAKISPYEERRFWGEEVGENVFLEEEEAIKEIKHRKDKKNGEINH